MLSLRSVHHIAIICSSYEASKRFYTKIMGFTVVGEYYRAERDSYKLDLALNDTYTLELFSFPNPPARMSGPEARGLRHLAFAVDNIDAAVATLQANGITPEPVRTDEYTGKRYTFFQDPDNLPLELYES